MKQISKDPRAIQVDVPRHARKRRRGEKRFAIEVRWGRSKTWRVLKRYATERQRDEALVTLNGKDERFCKGLNIGRSHAFRAAIG